MSSRSGSPTVRMIVARSSARRRRWRIFSRCRCAPARRPCYNVSKLPRSWKYRNEAHYDDRHPPAGPCSPRMAYALVAGVIGLALFASGTPSPLYATYRELWGFSPVVLTLVYATYAFGVLTALRPRRARVRRGRAPARADRRAQRRSWARRCCSWSPTRSCGCSSRAASRASRPAWRSARRAPRCSTCTRAATPRASGLTNGVVSAAGMGLGVLVASAFVELAPAPRVLPYVALFVLFAIALAGALAMPEPVTARAAPAAHAAAPERARARSAARSSSPRSRSSRRGRSAACSSRSGRSSRRASSTPTNHLVAGLGVFVLAASGALAQLAFGRTAPWVGAAAGSVALAAGTAAHRPRRRRRTRARCSWPARVIGGAGFGVAFLGALRALSAAIPPEHRAARHVGLLRRRLRWRSRCRRCSPASLVTPLGLEATFELFGSIVAALALLVAFEAWRTRPRPAYPATTRASLSKRAAPAGLGLDAAHGVGPVGERHPRPVAVVVELHAHDRGLEHARPRASGPTA